MKTKHLLITSLTAISLATGSSSALAAGFVIDSFDLPPISPPGPPPANSGPNPINLTSLGASGNATFSGLDKTETIGGVRNFNYTLSGVGGTGVAPNSTGQVITGPGNFDGFLDIFNNSRATSTAELLYDNLNAAGVDQGNFNMLSGANDKKGIVITTIASDGIPFTYTLEIGDGNMMKASVTKPFDFEGELTEESQARFTFQEFLDQNAGLNFSNINYVKLIVNGNIGYDLTLSQIGTFEVPEPSTILGLLAFLGTGAFSIKRNKK